MLIASFLVSACSEQSAPQQASSDNKPSAPVAEAWKKPEQSCAADQPGFVSGYQNFPGMACPQISEEVKNYTARPAFRKQCQKLTGNNKRPKTVAQVMINECGPLKNQDGYYASMQVCCHTSPAETDITQKIINYDASLQCPKKNVQALATNLHFPNMACDGAKANAESNTGIGGYKRACENTSNNRTRQSILDASVYTCREDDMGAYVDVAVCCSATLPANKTSHPLSIIPDPWEAIRTNDLFALQLFLSRHPEKINDTDDQGMTMLHHATTPQLVNALLSIKPDLYVQDTNGMMPIHYAVLHKQSDIVERLVKAGKVIQKADASGLSPLSFAKDHHMASLLLAKGANTNIEGKSSPLHNAAYHGRLDVARLLLQHGADINQTDVNGETPLHRAAFRQHLDMVKFLVDSGADIHATSSAGKPRTPLQMTSNAAIRDFLISIGGK